MSKEQKNIQKSDKYSNKRLGLINARKKSVVEA